MPFKANSALLKKVPGLGWKAALCRHTRGVDAVLRKAKLNSLGFAEWIEQWKFLVVLYSLVLFLY